MRERCSCVVIPSMTVEMPRLAPSEAIARTMALSDHLEIGNFHRGFCRDVAGFSQYEQPNILRCYSKSFTGYIPVKELVRYMASAL